MTKNWPHMPPFYQSRQGALRHVGPKEHAAPPGRAAKARGVHWIGPKQILRKLRENPISLVWLGLFSFHIFGWFLLVGVFWWFVCLVWLVVSLIFWFMGILKMGCLFFLVVFLGDVVNFEWFVCFLYWFSFVFVCYFVCWVFRWLFLF